MSLTMGLEKEFFLLNSEELPLVIPKSLPADDGGLLVEARSKPFTSIIDAVFSLDADIFRIESIMSDKNVPGNLKDASSMKIPRKTMLEARRQYQKGLLKFQNIYGHEDHKHRLDEEPAGVHISFTNQRSVIVNGHTENFNLNWDWLSLFKRLDEAFKEEINQARRNPGFYEVKWDGRIEYRSLPANVPLNKIMDVVPKLIRELSL